MQEKKRRKEHKGRKLLIHQNDTIMILHLYNLNWIKANMFLITTVLFFSFFVCCCYKLVLFHCSIKPFDCTVIWLFWIFCELTLLLVVFLLFFVICAPRMSHKKCHIPYNWLCQAHWHRPNHLSNLLLIHSALRGRYQIANF